MMFYLSQRDPKWALDKIGSSKSTVGKLGCTLTCLSMLSSYFGGYLSPKEIAHNANNFLGDLVYWTRLNFKAFKFIWRDYKEDGLRITEHLKNPNKAVILEVDHIHWVVGVRKSLFGDYVIVDPWDGQKRNLKSKYRKVTGAAYFERIIK